MKAQMSTVANTRESQDLGVNDGGSRTLFVKRSDIYRFGITGCSAE